VFQVPKGRGTRHSAPKMNNKEFHIPSVSELPEAVKWLLKEANGRKKIMLYGQMGAGKTTFTKAFCQYLGVKKVASSPTFSLVNEYAYAENGVEKLIHHMDLYRLKSLEEALDIGIEDYLYDDDYCLIEWPQLIEPILTDDVLKISFEISSNSARKIVFL
jgi:tRNA threonylcarbamoyladenosine biosynthesis protein TsaE